MANRDLELSLRLKADVDKAIRDFQRAEKEIKDQGKAADTSKRKLAGMAGSYKALAGAVGAYISIAGARQVLKIADEYTVLQQRIKTATKDTGDFVEVNRRLFEITQQNGVAFRDTVSTFQSLARSREALDATNTEVLTLTDTIQKLGVIGGSSNEQLAAGLLQFSQALSAGTVRAEEINSVIENIPEVAKRIEKGLGLLPGTLKNAVNEGKVLSRDVFRVLVGQADEIQREFDELGTSLARAAERFENSVDRALGKLLGGQEGFSGLVADSLTGWSMLLDRMTEGKKIEEELRELQAERLKILARIEKASGRNRAGSQRRLTAIEARLRVLNEQALALANRPPKPEGGTGPDPNALKLYQKRLAVIQAAADAEARLLKAGLDRQLADLERQHEDALLAFRDFYGRRTELQQQAIDAEIARTRTLLDAERKASALAASDEDRLPVLARIKELETDIAVLEQQRAEAGGQGARDQAVAERELAEELENVRLRLLEAQGKSAEARTAQLEAEFRDLIQRLKVEGDTAGEAIVRQLIDVESARARLGQFESDFNLALTRMRNQEQRIDIERGAGLLGEFEARGKIIALHQATAAELEKIIPLMEKAATAIGPEAVARVETLKNEIAGLKTETNALVESSLQVGEDALGGFLTKIDDGVSDIGDAFRDMLRDIAQGISQLVSQELAKLAFSAAKGLFQTAHTGGVIGSSGLATKRVSPLAFVAAPRYHDGGIVGLQPGEVPIIAQKGEEVLRRDNPRHIDNVGNGGGVDMTAAIEAAIERAIAKMPGTRNIFIDDERDLGNWLNSAQGERVNIEFIRRNAMPIRQALGI